MPNARGLAVLPSTSPSVSTTCCSSASGCLRQRIRFVPAESPVRTWLPYQGQHPVSGLASDKCAKRWPPEMLLQPGRGLSEETVLLLKKQEQTIFSRVSASQGFFGASIRTRPNGLPGFCGAREAYQAVPKFT